MGMDEELVWREMVSSRSAAGVTPPHPEDKAILFAESCIKELLRREESSEREIDLLKARLYDEAEENHKLINELNAMYAELGIFRHTDKPERGADTIRTLQESNIKNIKSIREAIRNNVIDALNRHEAPMDVCQDVVDSIGIALKAVLPGPQSVPGEIGR